MNKTGTTIKYKSLAVYITLTHVCFIEQGMPIYMYAPTIRLLYLVQYSTHVVLGPFPAYMYVHAKT
jgi:hypothetical protein